MRRRQAYSEEIKREQQQKQAQAQKPKRAVGHDVRYGWKPRFSEETRKRFGEHQKRLIDEMRSSLPDGVSFKAGYCPFGCGKYCATGMFTHMRWCKSNPNRNSSPNLKGA